MLIERDSKSDLECLRTASDVSLLLGEIPERLRMIVSALDHAGEALPAIYVQTALDLLERRPAFSSAAGQKGNPVAG